MRLFLVVLAFLGPPSYEEAAAAYEAGEFERAAELFDQLVAEDPKPEYLYSLAQSLRRSNQCERAEHEFRRYLATGVTESQLDAVETLIAECDDGDEAGPTEPAVEPTPQQGPTGEPEGPTEPESPTSPVAPKEDGDPAKLIKAGVVGISVGSALTVGGAVLMGVFIARQGRENQGYADKGCGADVNDPDLFLTCQAHQDNATTAASIAFGGGVPALVLGVAGVTAGAIAISIGRKRQAELDMRVGFDLRNPGLSLSGRF